MLDRADFPAARNSSRLSVDVSDDMALVHPGDSAVQRAAETEMLTVLATSLGVTFESGRRDMPDGTRVELDAVARDPPVLVEAWAHHGRPKSAQKQKVMTDALKLVWAEAVLFPDGARKILALADHDAAAHFLGSTWMARALIHLGIEVVVVELPEETRRAIRQAQERQFR